MSSIGKLKCPNNNKKKKKPFIKLKVECFSIYFSDVVPSGNCANTCVIIIYTIVNEIIYNREILPTINNSFFGFKLLEIFDILRNKYI